MLSLPGMRLPWCCKDRLVSGAACFQGAGAEEYPPLSDCGNCCPRGDGAAWSLLAAHGEKSPTTAATTSTRIMNVTSRVAYMTALSQIDPVEGDCDDRGRLHLKLLLTTTCDHHTRWWKQLHVRISMGEMVTANDLLFATISSDVRPLGRLAPSELGSVFQSNRCTFASCKAQAPS